MALNIKSDEADALARELAGRRGLTITQVIIDALRADLERVRRSERSDFLVQELLAIGRRAAALPVVDTRSEEEILGYDEMLDPP